MTEAAVEKKDGSYLFCDTDSLAIVASEDGGRLQTPGSEDVRFSHGKRYRQLLTNSLH
jgi:hypothetical protein